MRSGLFFPGLVAVLQVARGSDKPVLPVLLPVHAQDYRSLQVEVEFLQGLADQPASIGVPVDEGEDQDRYGGSSSLCFPSGSAPENADCAWKAENSGDRPISSNATAPTRMTLMEATGPRAGLEPTSLST
jgi:hypothetical protein